jgi:Cdc6-like AAA superfamily ATPase
MSPEIPNSQPGEQAIKLRLLENVDQEVISALANKEFIAYRNSENELKDELMKRLDVTLEEFRGEISAVIEVEESQKINKLAEMRQKRIFWSLAGIFFSVLLYLMVTIPLRHEHVSLPTPLITSLTGVFWADLGASVFAFIALGIFLASVELLPAARRSIVLVRDHERAMLRYEPRLRIYVAEQMRLIIPSLPEPLTKVAFLEYSSALVELALAETISTKAMTTVQRFVTSHEASALGLAGPRGAGKSTILNFLTSMEGTLGIYIPAPVRYEPNELLARILEELANKYLGQDWQLSSLDALRTRKLWLAIAVTPLFVAIGLIGGVTLYLTDPQLGLDPARWIGVVLVLSSLGLLGFLMKRMLDSRSLRYGRERDASPEGRAEIILRNLRWQQERTSSLALKAEPWGGLLKIESEKSATSTERELGRPRLVADFQDFIRTIIKSHKFKRIIIAIDELDKLATTDDLIAVINEVKDILHIEGTHVIVSVSHDALYRFLLRGLPSRDVFDSTFDEIIQIPMLDASESVEVLQKRAVGFPANWGVACYILSGGLPRDLLRYGRRCVEIYQQTDGSIASVPSQLLGELAAEKVLAELQASSISSHLTPVGRDKLESAVSAARKGSISDIVGFVNEIHDGVAPRIIEWLTGLTEIMKFVQSSSVNEQSSEAASLARQLRPNEIADY